MNDESSTFNSIFKVCHGSGLTLEESQNDAASRALLLIVDNGLNNSDDNVPSSEPSKKTSAAATDQDHHQKEDESRIKIKDKPNEVVVVSAAAVLDDTS